LASKDHDPDAVELEVDAIVAALRAVGAEVIMVAPSDMSQANRLPDDFKPTWRLLIERMSALAARFAQRHGAVLIDFRNHPAGSDASIYSHDRIHLNARGHAIWAVHTLNTLAQRVAEPASRAT
jgi:hypothetical protein